MLNLRKCWIHTLLMVNSCEMCVMDEYLLAILHGNCFLTRTESGRWKVLDPAGVIVRYVAV